MATTYNDPNMDYQKQISKAVSEQTKSNPSSLTSDNNAGQQQRNGIFSYGSTSNASFQAPKDAVNYSETKAAAPKPVTYTYNADTDYQQMINDAVARGDYASAAIYEQQRNAKIDAEGITEYAKTNNYSKYLQNPQAVPNYTYDVNANYQQMIDEAVARGDYATAAILEQQRNAKIYGEGIGDYNQTNYYASYLPGGTNYVQGQIANFQNNNEEMTTEELLQLYLDIAANGGGTASSQADYINQIYDMAAQQIQAQLEQDYAEQVAGFDRAEQENNRNYQSNVNQALANAAKDRISFAETANAYGLTSGSAAQAALSMQNQTSQNINQLRVAQQTAQQEITLQRETAKTQYEAAIREAIANNDYQRAQALYNEAIRVDDSLVANGQNVANAIMNYINTVINYNQQNEQTDYEQQLTAAEYAAAMGDYTLMGQLFGWSQDQINRLNNSWAAQNPVKTYSSGGGSRGGGGYRYSSGGSGGNSGSSGSSSTITSASQLGSAALAIANGMSRLNGTNQGRTESIMNAFYSGRITQAEADFLLGLIGY